MLGNNHAPPSNTINTINTGEPGFYTTTGFGGIEVRNPDTDTTSGGTSGGLTAAEASLTTGQPDRGAGAYQFTGHHIDVDEQHGDDAHRHPHRRAPGRARDDRHPDEDQRAAGVHALLQQQAHEVVAQRAVLVVQHPWIGDRFRVRIVGAAVVNALKCLVAEKLTGWERAEALGRSLDGALLFMVTDSPRTSAIRYVLNEIGRAHV